MKSTSSSAPTLELGPRMSVPRELRGCRGCMSYSLLRKQCTVTDDTPEPPFWVYIQGHSNYVGTHEGFSCARWVKAGPSIPRTGQGKDNSECQTKVL